MKTIYIDCGMGAAGDMLAGALLELLPEKEEFLRRFNQLGIPGVMVAAERSVKCGIAGTHFSVKVHGSEEEEYGIGKHEHSPGEHDTDGHKHGAGEHAMEGHEYDTGEYEHIHRHHHGSMVDIHSIICSLQIPDCVKRDIRSVYQGIAEAESQAHGIPVDQIHFHEVGTMDAVADITAVCLLMHELGIGKVIASPVHVGSGSVRCAHGILPVPAPATAHILKNVPIYGGSIYGELCTPTGAMLLKHFVTEFGPMPAMKVQAIGYGMGRKEFERANCVRVMLGETEDRTEAILELNCNVDDMTGEAIGFAMEQFLEQGALDVFTVPIGGKKSRPGILITVLCRESEKEKFVSLIFMHTSTLGVREKRCDRYMLERRIESVDTPYGKMRKKISTGYGVNRTKYEYDDLAKAAKEHNISIEKMLEAIE